MGEALTRFRHLFRHVPGEDPAQGQRRAAQELPAAVTKAGLNWWQVDQPLPLGGRVLLIGAAVWSGYDLNTLDYVAAAARSGSSRGLAVYVFDADTVRSQEHLESIFPGLASGHHTPFVGFWQDGQLVETECGYAGRQIIARILDIDDAPLHQRITATVSST